ncbi:MAG: MFS transporter [Gluconacetobacter diazotrophicus]|nr:MFS transporter [Gluconacetobacter diazotrophicus]
MSTSLPIHRPILGNGAFLRLWGAGGVSAAMLWLEILAASLFTFEATGSSLAVAAVSAARAAPLLLFGAVAGVMSDAWNRRSIVLGGLVLSAVSAGSVAMLGSAGLARPWHLAVAAFVSGCAYATEFPARRRMVAEAVPVERIDGAVAVDSLTSYAARCGGPIVGGLAFQHLGLGGTFAISCLCNGAIVAAVAGLRHHQATRVLRLDRFRDALRAALRFAARAPTLRSLLYVTVVMNLCGYSYATLIAPVGLRSLGLDSTGTGLLAAAEPAGALLGGVVLTRILPPGSRLGWLMGGVAVLSCGLLAAAALGGAAAPFSLICLVLAVGGFGSAIYTLSQTTLALAATPPELRSRVMGLITVCIGSWPLGMLLAGGLAALLPPLGALAALAGTGLVLIGLVALVGTREA